MAKSPTKADLLKKIGNKLSKEELVQLAQSIESGSFTLVPAPNPADVTPPPNPLPDMGPSTPGTEGSMFQPSAQP